MKLAKRISSWRNALTHFFKGTVYCLRKAPYATFFAIMLLFLCKAIMPLATWAQAQAVAIVSNFSGQGDILWNLTLVLLLFCIVASYMDMRGYVTLPLSKIIEGKASFYCSKCIMKAINKISLKELDREETNTSIRRALDRALDFQGDVMMCADVLGGIFALMLYWSVMVTYRYGFLYVFISLLMAVMLKLYHLKFTELETDMKVKQASANRKADYFYHIQTDKECVSGVKIDGVFDLLRDKWVSLKEQTIKEKISLSKWWYKRSFIASGLNQLLYLIMMGMLTYNVIADAITLSAFIYLSGAVISSSTILVQFVNSCEWFYGRGVTIEEMNDWVRVGEEEIKADELAHTCKEGGISVDPSLPAIELRNVDFSYIAGRKVLKNISFKLNSNEIVAVVGPNGGGKSTLMKVVMGLLPPDSGEAYFFGKPYSEYTLEQRNSMQGVIYQDFVKFQLSFRENIGFGYLPLINDDKSINKAVEDGGCLEVLECVGDMEHILGREFDENGVELSGGQWQRIALSRSFMGNLLMIIFDEPTAAIDPLSEVKQFLDLKNYLAGKCGILVTHRVGLARLADKIMYLNNGVITEIGTHEELMHLNGDYTKLYTQQAKWYIQENMI